MSSSSSNTLHLRFVYPVQTYHSDVRSFRVVQYEEGSDATADLFKFRHPSNGMAIGITNFERKNPSTEEWDRIGHIEWTSPLTGSVQLGDEEVDIKDLRRIKNGSGSRRFRYKGIEYKWKIDKDDLYCVDQGDNILAKWSQKNYDLLISTRRGGLIERVLVTCLLNLWFRLKDSW